jgi:hypothetical protein
MQALALTVLTAGPLGVALLAVERTFKVVKHVSQVVEDAEAHMSLKHHHSRVGYQQEVRALLITRSLQLHGDLCTQQRLSRIGKPR